MIVGGGDGTVGIIKSNTEQSKANPKALKPMAMLSSVKVEGAITSIVLDEVKQKQFTFYVGTSSCNIYKFVYDPAIAK
jgi:hypothetical protein